MKKRSILTILLVLLALCAASGLLAWKLLIPATAYRKAEALLEAGQFEEAADSFLLLGPFRDSELRAEQARTAAEEARAEAERAAAYAEADALLSNGSYESAAEAFLALGDYRDSIGKAEQAEEALRELNYTAATAMMRDRHYSEAAEAFRSLGDYLDSAEMAEQAQALFDRNAALAAAEVGDTVFFGRYEQDNNTDNGPEEIEWLVLDKADNRLMVISRYGLDAQPFQVKTAKQSGLWVTWKECSLRPWLNGDFFDAAFNPEEQQMIPTVEVLMDPKTAASVEPSNTGYPKRLFGSPGSPRHDSEDKIFLLSYPEAQQYFPSNEDRLCYPTEYAVAQGVHIAQDGICKWWLRTNGLIISACTIVTRTGSLYSMGEAKFDTSIAVRPVLWIDTGV